MLRLRRIPAALVGLALATLCLAGCSDSLSGNDTSFAKVNADYKKALTPQAKKSVISSMQKERTQRQKAAGIEEETTSSTKPAKAQN